MNSRAFSPQKPETHVKLSSSSRDRPVSEAPTTTMLAFTLTFDSKANFLLIRLRANGTWRGQRGRRLEPVLVRLVE